MDNSKSIWSFYYDTSEQKIAIYKGTSSDDILKLIRQIYNIPEDQKLLFLDEDGIPIVLSSMIPNATKIFLQKHQTETEKIIKEMKDINWIWLEPGKDSHQRKNNNLTVYQPVNITQSYCFGNLVIENGKIYYTLLFEPLMCCVYAGIEQTGSDFREKQSDFLTDIALYSLFDIKRSTQKPAIEVGFLVDMERRLLIITDHRERQIKKSFQIQKDWKKVSPLVYFKHVVSITISNGILQIPEWAKKYELV